MTAFRAPDTTSLPPARCLPSSQIGAWMGVLRSLPSLSDAMSTWLVDAKQQLVWRETCQPRVVETRVVSKRTGRRLKFAVDDSLSDVQRDDGES